MFSLVWLRYQIPGREIQFFGSIFFWKGRVRIPTLDSAFFVARSGPDPYFRIRIFVERSAPDPYFRIRIFVERSGPDPYFRILIFVERSGSLLSNPHFCWKVRSGSLLSNPDFFWKVGSGSLLSEPGPNFKNADPQHRRFRQKANTLSWFANFCHSRASDERAGLMFRFFTVKPDLSSDKIIPDPE